MSMMIKTYTELSRLESFEERFDYLKLHGKVGYDTFGFDRIFNQMFYRSNEWKNVKSKVIARDNACDLGVEGYEIFSGDRIIVHHMNPIDINDIRDATEYLFNPEYLITTRFKTHNAIHYGTRQYVNKFNARTPNDTCPWR